MAELQKQLLLANNGPHFKWRSGIAVFTNNTDNKEFEESYGNGNSKDINDKSNISDKESDASKNIDKVSLYRHNTNRMKIQKKDGMIEINDLPKQVDSGDSSGEELLDEEPGI